MKAKPAKHSGEVILEVNRADEDFLATASASSLRIKQVLVPIDFSVCSRKALRYAIPLAKEHKASITLAYVVPQISAIGEYGGIDYAAVTKEMREGAEKQLAALAVDEVRGVVATDTIVRTGSPVAEIVSIAKKIPADMIVISTHGRGGLKHVLLGSVAERVVRHAPCPVLVVRERERDIV
ncbi:MAG: universal stress protein [Verrucomicrobia subdivision 3 bacterium]|nr:universal stress protein [Limisphaerales bacterium]